jgi:hypothetical protein
MWPLRQSTASQEIPLGQFVDSTDAVTPETGLTIANTDIKLHKSGATSEVNKNSGGATHVASGRYYAVLDATDTNTPGPMRISVLVAGALYVKLDCIVYPTAVYDQMFTVTTGVFQLAVDPLVGFQTQSDLLNNISGADATLSVATLASIADKLLGRNIAGGADGGRTVSQALARLRNRSTLVGGNTVRVYAADGTTILYSSSVTIDGTNGQVTEFAPTS